MTGEKQHESKTASCIDGSESILDLVSIASAAAIRPTVILTKVSREE